VCGDESHFVDFGAEGLRGGGVEGGLGLGGEVGKFSGEIGTQEDIVHVES